jgi:transposase-like protein
MDLEWPFPAGLQHFRPPFCPRVDCRSGADGSAFRFWYRGRYRRACDGRIVHRFHCHNCRRSFSVQTFRVDYRLRRPQLTAPIFDAFVSKVTQRQTARTLLCTRQTVRRRLLLLARHSRDFHAAALARMRARGGFGGHFQLDEQETFERDRLLQPVTMPVLIHAPSRFVVHVETAPLPARGGLRKSDEERKRRLEAKLGVRLSGSREAVKRCFAVLNQALGPALAVVLTDQKSSYPTILAETMTGRYLHEAHSGRAAKTRENPLWPINHTLGMLRDGLSRLVRRNWGNSKERAWLGEHAWVWIAYRNYIRYFTNKIKRTSSARLAGVVRRSFSKATFFEWRVFSTARIASEGGQYPGGITG